MKNGGGLLAPDASAKWDGANYKKRFLTPLMFRFTTEGTEGTEGILGVQKDRWHKAEGEETTRKRKRFYHQGTKTPRAPRHKENQRSAKWDGATIKKGS
jgi:hypothetical protein